MSAQKAQAERYSWVQMGTLWADQKYSGYSEIMRIII